MFYSVFFVCIFFYTKRFSCMKQGFIQNCQTPPYYEHSNYRYSLYTRAGLYKYFRIFYIWYVHSTTINHTTSSWWRKIWDWKLYSTSLAILHCAQDIKIDWPIILFCIPRNPAPQAIPTCCFRALIRSRPQWLFDPHCNQKRQLRFGCLFHW